jgi:hypothetical protein
MELMSVVDRIFTGVVVLLVFFLVSGRSLQAQSDAAATSEAVAKLNSISRNQIEQATNYGISPAARPLFRYDRISQSMATERPTPDSPPVAGQREAGSDPNGNNDFLSVSYQVPGFFEVHNG